MSFEIFAALVLKFGSGDKVAMPGGFWLVAVPCVGFVFFLVVDAFVVKIKKRRLHKLQMPTNEFSTFRPVARKSESSPHSKQVFLR